MLDKQLKKLIFSAFIKDVSVVAFGAIISQVISIGSVILLAKLYTPYQFGNLSTFTSITMFLSVVTTWKFELAIVLPEKEEDALNLVSLGFLLTIVTSLLAIILFLCLAFIDLYPSRFVYIILVPFNAMSLGMTSLLQLYILRKKGYRNVSIVNIIQNVLLLIINIILYAFSFKDGLMWAYSLTQFLTLFIYAYIFSKEHKNVIKLFIFDIKILKSLFKRYINFPKYLLWSEFLLMFSQQSPPLLLGIFFNQVIVGNFSVAYRMLRVPTMIIGNAIGNVFINEANNIIKTNNNCDALYISIFKKLLIVAFPIFVFLSITAPFLFEFFLGQKWNISGYYARIMSPMLFFELLIQPFLSLYIIYEKQKLNFIIRLITNIALVISIYLGYTLFKIPDISIFLLCIVFICSNIYHGITTFNLSKIKKMG